MNRSFLCIFHARRINNGGGEPGEIAYERMRDGGARREGFTGNGGERCTQETEPAIPHGREMVF